MMMGDAYRLPIQITTAAGVADLESFEELEVFFGDVRKTLSTGEVTYDNVRQVFLVPLSQKETFRQQGVVEVQIRVKTFDGDVIGETIGEVDVLKSTSKVVL